MNNYNLNLDDYSWDEQYKKLYLEGKNNINGKNIEIYVNNKKIEFDYKYKNNEKGNIKVIFKFNKLLTSTNSIFRNCPSLESIDLSSFNTSNVNDMSGMFLSASSLKSIDLSSINTSNVKNMSGMFCLCSSLKSIDLSSLNTSNVNNMSFMLNGCSSLKSIDLSSFNTSNVHDMSFMFSGCSSLKKENIKINESGKRILDIDNFI